MIKLFGYALFALLFTACSSIAGEFPNTNANGDPTAYRYYSGKVLSPNNGPGYTTLDSMAFWFISSAIRLCYRAPGDATNTIYIRFNSTATLVTASLDTFNAPASTPAAFQEGVAGTKSSHRAMTMGGVGDGTDTHCSTIPIAAPGVIVHFPLGSGSFATIDVTGFR